MKEMKNRFQPQSASNYNYDFHPLTEHDIKTLREAGPLVLPYIPEVIDQFYTKLEKNPQYQQWFDSKEDIERLKKVQYNYFCSIFEGRFDDTHFEIRKQIGESHHQIGLTPQSFSGGYTVYCEILFPILLHLFYEQPERLNQIQTALIKVFFMDIHLAMDSYIDRYAHELLEASHALEQKLWLEDRLLSFILTEAGDAIVGLDEQDRISTWSQGAQRLFGYKTSEILDKSLFDLLKNSNEADKLKQVTLEEESTTIYEAEWVTKSGHPFTADATLTLLRNKNGGHIGSTLIVRDTAEIRRLASKVKNMEQLAAMTKITAGVAHEIRTPLGVIALTTDLLADRLLEAVDSIHDGNREKIKYEIKEFTSDLQREVDRMNEIVNHYLVLSRIKQPSKKKVHLKTYLQNILNDLSSRRPDKDIMFYLNVHDDEVYVNIDKDQFRRVFLNLFENSQYSIQNAGIITIVTKTKNNSIQFEFHDTGFGIPKNQMPHMFSAFHTNKPGGTGLGLYLVREIVEAHNGQVHIESQEGKGTTVIFTIPSMEVKE